MTQSQLANTLPLPQASKRRQGSRLAGLKRYSLSLPEELFNEVQELADKRQTSVIDLLRRFIKLGLLAAQIDGDPNAALIIRQNGTDREIVLV